VDSLLITIGNDELLGLQALARFEGADGAASHGADGSHAADVEQVQKLARLAMRDGLEGRLRMVDLAWAPTAEAVDQALLASTPAGPRAQAAPVAQASGPGASPATRASANASGAPVTPVARFRAIGKNERVKRNAGMVLVFALLVVLIGGYGAGWKWTGFQANDQLWDWLHLLLLPAAFALLPVWLRYSEHMSRTRKVVLACAVAAFWVFVAVGYLVPLNWTGFEGQMLWNWLTLIALPVTLVTLRAWPTTGREVRKTHITVFTVLGIAWLVTLIGGYLGSWHWTGYPGNTLWDWLGLLLLPIVFPTILLPAFLRWTSGGATQRAKEAAAKEAAQAAQLPDTQPAAAQPPAAQAVAARARA
jgi:hypothetical protein